MQEELFLHFKDITIDPVNWNLSDNIAWDMLRLDKIHPIISGNKYFKMKYHIVEYYKNHFKGIIFFGGGYSNLIVAAGKYCQEMQIPCVGIIRGIYHEPLPSTLIEAKNCGMQLVFLSQQEYAQRHTDVYKAQLLEQYPGYYIIWDGGYAPQGAQGIEEIMHEKIISLYDFWIAAIGTGTMFAGMCNAAPETTQLIGINCLKYESIAQEIDPLLKQPNPKQYTILNDYHFGGFAKKKDTLLNFMNKFYTQTTIPLDFVYSGKTAFAINDLIQKKYFPQGSKILMIHCGGLQGNTSLPKNSLIY